MTANPNVIRFASHFDKDEIIAMMLEFQGEVDNLLKVNNPEHWHRLLDQIFAGGGAVILAPGKGLLMCVVGPSVFCDKTLLLQEVAWYVRPLFRQGTTGYRLLERYVELGDRLKDEGRIAAFTISRLMQSDPINFGRFGFIKHHETWSH